MHIAVRCILFTVCRGSQSTAVPNERLDGTSSTLPRTYVARPDAAFSHGRTDRSAQPDRPAGTHESRPRPASPSRALPARLHACTAGMHVAARPLAASRSLRSRMRCTSGRASYINQEKVYGKRKFMVRYAVYVCESILY